MTFKPFSEPYDYSLKILKERLGVIQDQGFLQIFGKNKDRDSAMGESIEYYLGIKKNSSKSADWGNYEIKTYSQSKNQKIRLFNLKWEFIQGLTLKKLAFKYGKDHFSKHLQKQSKRLDHVINYSEKPKNVLYIYIPDNSSRIELKYENNILGIIEMKKIEEHFQLKLRNLVLINTEKQKINNQFEFRINKVEVLENASFNSFINQIRSNLIRIYFALFLVSPNRPDEQFRNHGSAIGGPLNNIIEIYDRKSNLE